MSLLHEFIALNRRRRMVGVDHAVKFQTRPRGRDEWIVLLVVAENEFVMRNKETL